MSWLGRKRIIMGAAERRWFMPSHKMEREQGADAAYALPRCRAKS
jgi:hypothetical protein